MSGCLGGACSVPGGSARSDGSGESTPWTKQFVALTVSIFFILSAILLSLVPTASAGGTDRASEDLTGHALNGSTIKVKNVGSSTAVIDAYAKKKRESLDYHDTFEVRDEGNVDELTLIPGESAEIKVNGLADGIAVVSKRGFIYPIDTTTVIRGRTEPGAPVTVSGSPVIDKTYADEEGYFELVIPASAVEGDEHEFHIIAGDAVKPGQFGPNDKSQGWMGFKEGRVIETVEFGTTEDVGEIDLKFDPLEVQYDLSSAVADFSEEIGASVRKVIEENGKEIHRITRGRNVKFEGWESEGGVEISFERIHNFPEDENVTLDVNDYSDLEDVEIADHPGLRAVERGHKEGSFSISAVPKSLGAVGSLKASIHAGGKEVFDLGEEIGGDDLPEEWKEWLEIGLGKNKIRFKAPRVLKDRWSKTNVKTAGGKYKFTKVQFERYGPGDYGSERIPIEIRSGGEGEKFEGKVRLSITGADPSLNAELVDEEVYVGEGEGVNTTLRISPDDPEKGGKNKKAVTIMAEEVNPDGSEPLSVEMGVVVNLEAASEKTEDEVSDSWQEWFKLDADGKIYAWNEWTTESYSTTTTKTEESTQTEEFMLEDYSGWMDAYDAAERWASKGDMGVTTKIKLTGYIEQYLGDYKAPLGGTPDYINLPPSDYEPEVKELRKERKVVKWLEKESKKYDTGGAASDKFTELINTNLDALDTWEDPVYKNIKMENETDYSEPIEWGAGWWEKNYTFLSFNDKSKAEDNLEDVKNISYYYGERMYPTKYGAKWYTRDYHWNTYNSKQAAEWAAFNYGTYNGEVEPYKYKAKWYTNETKTSWFDYYSDANAFGDVVDSKPSDYEYEAKRTTWKDKSSGSYDEWSDADDRRDSLKNESGVKDVSIEWDWTDYDEYVTKTHREWFDDSWDHDGEQVGKKCVDYNTNYYDCNPHNCNPHNCNPHNCNCHQVCDTCSDTDCWSDCSWNYSCHQVCTGWWIWRTCHQECGWNRSCHQVCDTDYYSCNCHQVCDTCYDTCYDTCWDTCSNTYCADHDYKIKWTESHWEGGYDYTVEWKSEEHHSKWFDSYSDAELYGSVVDSRPSDYEYKSEMTYRDYDSTTTYTESYADSMATKDDRHRVHVKPVKWEASWNTRNYDSDVCWNQSRAESLATKNDRHKVYAKPIEWQVEYYEKDWKYEDGFKSESAAEDAYNERYKHGGYTYETDWGVDWTVSWETPHEREYKNSDDAWDKYWALDGKDGIKNLDIESKKVFVGYKAKRYGKIETQKKTTYTYSWKKPWYRRSSPSARFSADPYGTNGHKFRGDVELSVVDTSDSDLAAMLSDEKVSANGRDESVLSFGGKTHSYAGTAYEIGPISGDQWVKIRGKDANGPLTRTKKVELDIGTLGSDRSSESTRTTYGFEATGAPPFTAELTKHEVMYGHEGIILPLGMELKEYPPKIIIRRGDVKKMVWAIGGLKGKSAWAEIMPQYTPYKVVIKLKSMQTGRTQTLSFVLNPKGKLAPKVRMY